MARYSLNTLLRYTPNKLLKQYFEGESLLSDFSWTMQQGDEIVEMGEADIEELAKAVNDLPEKDFIKIESHFRHIAKLADDTGIQCLISQAEIRRYSVDLPKEFEEKKINGYYARSLWVWMKHKTIFVYVIRNQHLDNIPNWKECYVGKKVECDESDKAKGALAEGIIALCKKKGRGKRCQIDRYHRLKPDRYCFFAYPEDCTKPELGYDDKDKLDWLPRKSVFEVVFMYEKETGLLRVHSSKFRDARKIQQLFCQKIFKQEDFKEESRLVYDLSRLKTKEFNFESDLCIKRVKLKMLMLDLPDSERVTIEADPEDGKEMMLYDRMVTTMEGYDIDLERVKVKKAHFQVVFQPENGKAAKTRIVKLGVPDSSNLEDTHNDNIIKRHIDNKWKLRCKGSEEKPIKEKTKNESTGTSKDAGKTGQKQEQ